MELATKWPAPSHEVAGAFGATGLTSKQSSHVKVKLDALELVEDEDFSELTDICELRPQGGTSTKKVYKLTPEAFKTCLLRARRYPNQIVDPTVYSKYYLLLEKTYKLYTDYEKQLLNKHRKNG